METKLELLLAECCKHLHSISAELHNLVALQSGCDPLIRRMQTDYFDSKRDYLLEKAKEYFKGPFSEDDFLFVGLLSLRHEINITTLKNWLNIFILDKRIYKLDKDSYWFDKDTFPLQSEQCNQSNCPPQILKAFEDNPFLCYTKADLIRLLETKCSMLKTTARNRIEKALLNGVIVPVDGIQNKRGTTYALSKEWKSKIAVDNAVNNILNCIDFPPTATDNK